MFSVVHVGLGPIGIEIARLAATRGLLAAAAVDPAPGLVGSKLSDVTGHGAHSGIEVVASLDGRRADVALHSTGSHLQRVEDQIVALVGAGLNVVSTCEELSYPWWRNKERAQRIDDAAREEGVTVLGTGVNPGYAMDYLPLALSLPCQTVRAVSVHRVQDAVQRRIPLQRKVGAGLTVSEFSQRVTDGELGHVGLQESGHHIAAAFGWTSVRLEETIEPMLADTPMRAAIGLIEPGRVRGIHQVVEGFRDGERVLDLTLDMALGLREPRDVVVIAGVPRVEATIAAGIHGDIATAAMVVNSIGGVLSAAPGLVTGSELAPARILPRESVDTDSRK